MKTIERPTPSTPTQVIAGDEVRITTKAGRTYDLNVTQTSEDSIVGRDDSGKLWKVPFDQIQTLEVEEISTAKTAGAALAGVSLTAVTLFILGTVAFGMAIESAGGD